MARDGAVGLAGPVRTMHLIGGIVDGRKGADRRVFQEPKHAKPESF